MISINKVKQYFQQVKRKSKKKILHIKEHALDKLLILADKSSHYRGKGYSSHLVFDFILIWFEFISSKKEVVFELMLSSSDDSIFIFLNKRSLYKDRKYNRSDIRYK